MRPLPAVFIGHGSPMHALADNAYTRALGELGRALPRPAAVLAVSAHWEAPGPSLTHMARPRTIHDFGGFPDALFAVDYPAPGDPALAERAAALVGGRLDDGEWGLDHGTWAVLRHMYPRADVPVVQLSVDPGLSGREHLGLGRRLAPLREQGVLILGSGNVVHNLRLMKWTAHADPEPWNREFDDFVKERTEAGDAAALAGDVRAMPGGALSVPTPEHWHPYLYALGAAQGEPVRWVYEGLENASISMRSAQFGRA
jgi:4,5-DOPA dioxygenase extradiol